MGNESVIAPPEGRRVKGSQTKRSYLPYLFIGLLLAVCIVLLLSVLNQSTVVAPSGQVTQSTQEAGTIENDGFILQYPAGWEILPAEELARLNNHFDFAARRQNPPSVFSVRVQEGKPQNANIGVLAKALDQAMGIKLDGFQKHNDKVITLNDGQRALQYEYTFKSESGERVREVLVVVYANSKIYHAIAWATDKDFPNVRGEFDQMIASLSVK